MDAIICYFVTTISLFMCLYFFLAWRREGGKPINNDVMVRVNIVDENGNRIGWHIFTLPDKLNQSLKVDDVTITADIIQE